MTNYFGIEPFSRAKKKSEDVEPDEKLEPGYLFGIQPFSQMPAAPAELAPDPVAPDVEPAPSGWFERAMQSMAQPAGVFADLSPTTPVDPRSALLPENQNKLPYEVNNPFTGASMDYAPQTFPVPLPSAGEVGSAAVQGATGRVGELTAHAEDFYHQWNEAERYLQAYGAEGQDRLIADRQKLRAELGRAMWDGDPLGRTADEIRAAYPMLSNLDYMWTPLDEAQSDIEGLIYGDNPDEYTQNIQEKLEGIGTVEDFAKNLMPMIRQGAQEDLRNQQAVTGQYGMRWNNAKSELARGNPEAMLKFIGANLPSSMMDGLLASNPITILPYMVARAEEMALERAKRRTGAPFETPANVLPEDLAITIPAALTFSLMERFGIKGATGAAKDVLPGAGGAAERVGIAMGREAGTEAIQEPAELGVTSIGTLDEGTPEEYLERLQVGTTLGGIAGASMRGAVELTGTDREIDLVNFSDEFMKRARRNAGMPEEEQREEPEMPDVEDIDPVVTDPSEPTFEETADAQDDGDIAGPLPDDLDPELRAESIDTAAPLPNPDGPPPDDAMPYVGEVSDFDEEGLPKPKSQIDYEKWRENANEKADQQLPHIPYKKTDPSGNEYRSRNTFTNPQTGEQSPVVRIARETATDLAGREGRQGWRPYVWELLEDGSVKEVAGTLFKDLKEAKEAVRDHMRLGVIGEFPKKYQKYERPKKINIVISDDQLKAPDTAEQTPDLRQTKKAKELIAKAGSTKEMLDILFQDGPSSGAPNIYDLLQKNPESDEEAALKEWREWGLPSEVDTVEKLKGTLEAYQDSLTETETGNLPAAEKRWTEAIQSFSKDLVVRDLSDKKQFKDVIQQFHDQHHKRDTLNHRYQHALAVTKGGEGDNQIVVIATLGTPTGRWSADRKNEIIELQRVISDGSTKNAASLATKAAMELAKGQGKTLVTYSERSEAGSVYKALTSPSRDGYFLRPVALLPARKSRTGEQEPAKVRWEAGPNAMPTPANVAKALGLAQSTSPETDKSLTPFDKSFPASRLRSTLRKHGFENVSINEDGYASFETQFEWQDVNDKGEERTRKGRGEILIFFSPKIRAEADGKNTIYVRDDYSERGKDSESLKDVRQDVYDDWLAENYDRLVEIAKSSGAEQMFFFRASNKEFGGDILKAADKPALTPKEEANENRAIERKVVTPTTDTQKTKLLCIACSATKGEEGGGKVRDVYKGGMWEVLNKFEKDGGDMPTVLVFSGKYGWLTLDTVIPAYDEKLSKERSNDWAWQSLVDENLSDDIAIGLDEGGAEFDEVMFAGGEMYRDAMERSINDSRESGPTTAVFDIFADDIKFRYSATEPNTGIGTQKQNLKQWLSELAPDKSDEDADKPALTPFDKNYPAKLLRSMLTQSGLKDFSINKWGEVGFKTSFTWLKTGPMGREESIKGKGKIQIEFIERNKTILVEPADNTGPNVNLDLQSARGRAYERWITANRDKLIQFAELARASQMLFGKASPEYDWSATGETDRQKAMREEQEKESAERDARNEAREKQEEEQRKRDEEEERKKEEQEAQDEEDIRNERAEQAGLKTDQIDHRAWRVYVVTGGGEGVIIHLPDSSELGDLDLNENDLNAMLKAGILEESPFDEGWYNLTEAAEMWIGDNRKELEEKFGEFEKIENKYLAPKPGVRTTRKRTGQMPLALNSAINQVGGPFGVKRPSYYRSVFSMNGVDPDQAELWPEAKQINFIAEKIYEKFGIRIRKLKSADWRFSLDTTLDAYNNLHFMAEALGLSPQALGLEKSYDLILRRKGREMAAAEYYPAPFMDIYAGRGALTERPSIGIPDRSTSFVHEWGHALDFWLLGKTNWFDPATKGQALSGKGRQKGMAGKDPEELSRAFGRLLTAMYQGDPEVGELARRIAEMEKKLANTKSEKQRERYQKQIDALMAGNSKIRTTKTEYYEAARSTDNPAYWAMPTEMLARAFESYVSRQMHLFELEGREFLHSGEKFYRNKLNKLYPQADMESIFSAFDDVFAAIRNTQTLPGKRPDDELDLGKLAPSVVYGHSPTQFTGQAKVPAKEAVNREIDAFKNAWNELKKRVPGAARRVVSEGALDTTKGARTTAGDFARQLTYGLSRTMGGTLHSIYRKYGRKQGVLLHLIRRVDTSPGYNYGTVSGGTLDEATDREIKRRSNNLRRIMRKHGLTRDKSGKELYDALVGIAVAEGLAPAAADIRREMADFYYYLKQAGLKLGYAQQYLPRLVDMDKVDLDPEGFKAAAAVAYADVWDVDFLQGDRQNDLDTAMAMLRANDRITAQGYKNFGELLKDFKDENITKQEFLKRFNAQFNVDDLKKQWSELSAVKWLDALKINRDHVFIEARSPAAEFTKRRRLSANAEKALDGFMVDNAIDLLDRYVRSGVRRAEFERRFGERKWDGQQKTSYRDFLLNQMYREGYSPGDTEIVKRIYDTIVGPSRPVENQAWRSTLQWGHNIGLMILLSRAWMSALAEPVTMRSAALVDVENHKGLVQDVKETAEAYKGVFASIKDVIKEATERMDTEDLYYLSELFAVVADVSAEEFMQNRYDMDYRPGSRLGKISPVYFESVLLAPQFRIQQRIATNWTWNRMMQLAEAWERSPDKHTAIKYELTYYGIPEEKIPAVIEWLKPFRKVDRRSSNNRAKLPTGSDIDTPIGRIIEVAINRYVDRQIQNPRTTDRLKISRSVPPMGQVATGILSFAGAYGRNLTLAFWRRNQEKRKFYEKRGGYKGGFKAGPGGRGPNVDYETWRRFTTYLGALFALQFMATVLRTALFQKDDWEEWDDEDKLLRNLAELALYRTGIFGLSEIPIQIKRQLRYDFNLMALPFGPTGQYVNRMIEDLIAPWEAGNTETTNTDEYRFMRGIYSMVVAPLLVGGIVWAGLTIGPITAISAGLLGGTFGMSSSAKNAWAKLWFGEKGSKTHGNWERGYGPPRGQKKGVKRFN